MEDFFTRKKKIDALRERIQAELEEWSKENEVLDDGETLYFNLIVIKRDSECPPRVKHIKKIPSPPPRLMEISEADWQKILATDFSDQLKIILNRLYATGNQPTTFRYRPNSKRRQRLEYGNWSNFDYQFKKFKLPYKVKFIGEGKWDYNVKDDHNSYYEDLCFQLWTKPPQDLKKV